MKKLFLLIAAVLVLSVPAFATDDVHFATGEFTISNPNGNTYKLESYQDDTVYYFLKWEDSTNKTMELVAISVGRDSRYTWTNVDTGGSYTEKIDSYFATDANSVGYYYDGAFSGISLQAEFIPSIVPFAYGTSNGDIVSALTDYIANPPVDAPVGKFSVPCGNVAYFQVATSQTVNFKSVYQILSRPFANSTYGYWSDSGQRFGSASGLPTSSTSYPLSSQSALYWSPDPQSKNLLGLSKTGLASASCSAGQWYAFYNPAYNSNNTDFTTMDITGATVSISGSFSAVKIFPLEQVVDYQNGAFVGSSNDGYTSYYDGTIGEDGNVTFTDQNGNAGTPTAGGQNLLAPNETYQSIIDKVVGLLKNIVSEIKNLFSFGYEAINDLAGLMSNFGRSLSGLYSWLPSEVHAALISAVSIAIVIGVFKVFI